MLAEEPPDDARRAPVGTRAFQANVMSSDPDLPARTTTGPNRRRRCRPTALEHPSVLATPGDHLGDGCASGLNCPESTGGWGRAAEMCPALCVSKGWGAIVTTSCEPSWI